MINPTHKNNKGGETESPESPESLPPSIEVPPHIAAESKIVWLVPLDQLPRYVREDSIHCPFRARRPGRHREPHHMVGYAELRPDAPGRHGIFERRVFWLAAHDPYQGTGAPCEAVDPRTVAAGVPGRMTSQAWGGPATSDAPVDSAEGIIVETPRGQREGRVPPASQISTPELDTVTQTFPTLDRGA